MQVKATRMPAICGIWTNTHTGSDADIILTTSASGCWKNLLQYRVSRVRWLLPRASKVWGLRSSRPLYRAEWSVWLCNPRRRAKLDQKFAERTLLHSSITVETLVFRNASSVRNIVRFVARFQDHIASNKTAVIPNLCEDNFLLLCRTTTTLLSELFDWYIFFLHPLLFEG